MSAEQSDVTRARLSVDRIVDEALDLARQEGVRGMSMRPLAARFGVSATALYGHVASRDALLGLMLHRILDAVPPLEPDLPWDEAMRRGAFRMRDAFAGYPQLALEALSGHAANEQTRAGHAEMVRRMTDGGFSAEDADTGVSCWGRWTLSYLAAAEYSYEGDEQRTNQLFEQGVELLLDGLRQQLG